MLNPWEARWRANEFFAFSGFRLGRKYNWAESFCSLPSRLAACVGAQVGLHRSPILRAGIYTIAHLAIDFYPVIFGLIHYPTLTNHSGHSLREKADILNRDFVDFSSRY